MNRNREHRGKIDNSGVLFISYTFDALISYRDLKHRKENPIPRMVSVYFSYLTVSLANTVQLAV